MKKITLTIAAVFLMGCGSPPSTNEQVIIEEKLPYIEQGVGTGKFKVHVREANGMHNVSNCISNREAAEGRARGYALPYYEAKVVEVSEAECGRIGTHYKPPKSIIPYEDPFPIPNI